MLSFVLRMGRLHPTFSLKSVVVASSDKVAKLIAEQLRDSGVSVKRDRSARDLGIVVAPGRRRNTTLQVKGFRAASRDSWSALARCFWLSGDTRRLVSRLLWFPGFGLCVRLPLV